MPNIWLSVQNKVILFKCQTFAGINTKEEFCCVDWDCCVELSGRGYNSSGQMCGQGSQSIIKLFVHHWKKM